jgi:hypothetical protein
MILLEKIDPWQAAKFVRFLRKKCSQVVLGLGHNVCDSLYMERSSVSVSMHLDVVSPCDLACDISVKRLESISKMLLVNGGLLRERIQSLLNYVLPRNTVFGLLQCVYGAHSGVTGTPLFNEAAVVYVLMICTMLPALSRAIFNQKLPPSLLQVSPQHYMRSRVKRLPWYRFILVNLMSGVAAVLLLEASFLIMKDSQRPYGDSFSHAQFSFAIESSFAVCCLCFHAPTCNTWPRVHHVFVWGPIILFYIAGRGFSDRISSGAERGSVSSVTEVALYWVMLVLYAGISFFLTIWYQLFRRFYKEECVREKAKDLGSEIRPEGSIVVADLYRS